MVLLIRWTFKISRKGFTKGNFNFFLSWWQGKYFPVWHGKYSKDSDLLLIETIFSFKKVHVSTIVIKQMDSIINGKVRRNGIPYGFWMNWVFEHQHWVWEDESWLSEGNVWYHKSCEKQMHSHDEWWVIQVLGSQPHRWKGTIAERNGDPNYFVHFNRCRDSCVEGIFQKNRNKIEKNIREECVCQNCCPAAKGVKDRHISSFLK